jgi:protease-4
VGLVILAVLVVLGLGLVGLVFVVRAVFSDGSYFTEEGGLAGYELQVEESGKGARSVLLIPVHGIISSAEGTGPVVISQLRRLRQDSRPGGVKVVLLHVDSPGGDVTTCDIIDDEIQKCKAKGIRFVAFFSDTAASGGYYVSARADKIIARRTSITGSIGVILLHFDAQKLLTEKLGVKDESVTSGPFKDVPSFFRPMSPEERAYMQNIVDKLYARFVEVVAQGRGLKEVDVRKFADGRVFLAEEAQKLKIIDRVGTRDDAVAEARKLAGEDATVIVYRRRPSPLQLLLQGGVRQSPMPRELATLADFAAQGRFLYLWRP